MPPENQETVTSPDGAPERADAEVEIARSAHFTACPRSGKHFRVNRMLDGVKPALLAPGRSGLTPAAHMCGPDGTASSGRPSGNAHNPSGCSHIPEKLSRYPSMLVMVSNFPVLVPLRLTAGLFQQDPDTYL